MSFPIGLAVVKSKGVPTTSASSPVGIWCSSQGRYVSAAMDSRWSNTSPFPSPLRLKKAWLVRLITVGLSVSARSEEHTSELQSRENLVCRLLLEKKHYH